MISPGWNRERNLLIFLLLVGIGGFWWKPEMPFLPLAAITTIFSFWYLRQALRMREWLKDHDPSRPLDSSGLWADIFFQTQRIAKRNLIHHQRLQDVLNRIQDSTSALPDAVIMVDRNGNLEWWNKTAERFLGLRSPEDVNQPITNLIRSPEFATYFEKCDYSEPFVMQAPQRRELFLEFNITLFGRNDHLVVVHDVTRLRSLEQMRKDFVANVSHELRTPLTVITGYLETMGQLTDDMPPVGKRMLKQMQEQSRRMEAIIRDLLVLSRLETKAADKMEEIKIKNLLEIITEEARALSNNQHDIQLIMDTQHNVLGFEHELRSAFSNLAVNAVKYSPAGSAIKIRWYEDAHHYCFSVQDTGTGISPEHLPRLTERFYRADPSRSKETGGTGLGLAIVKHVLIRHNADLKIESELDKGSCFIAQFPKN